ncbi:MAG: DUF3784 domain-containing protein [Clostridia bacterium]
MIYLPGVFVMGLLAILFLTIGLVLIIGHTITLIHSYHWQNVKEEDKKIYTTKMGISFLIFFASLLIGSLVNLFTKTNWGWLLFGVGMIIGSIFLYYVQKKYNGGMFS